MTRPQHRRPGPVARRSQRERDLYARLRGTTFALECAFARLGRAASAAADAFAAVAIHIKPIQIERGTDHAQDE